LQIKKNTERILEFFSCCTAQIRGRPGRCLAPRPGPPPSPPAAFEVAVGVTGKPIAAGSVKPTAASVSRTISGTVSVMPTAAAISGPISGTVSGTGTVKTSRASAGFRAGLSPVLMRLLNWESLGSVPVPSTLAAVLVPGTGGASVGLTVGPCELRGSPVVGSGSGAGVLTSLPFPVLSLVSRIGHLLDEVQGHLGIDVTGRMEGPTLP
jgi:hypothetical protein